MSRAKACQLLITKGYNVWIPVATSTALVVEIDNVLKKCLIRMASHPTVGQPIITVAKRTKEHRCFIDEEAADCILCIDNDKLWLLPMSDVASFSSLRLGKKWEHCILPAVEFSRSSGVDVGMLNESLRVAANEAVERLK